MTRQEWLIIWELEAVRDARMLANVQARTWREYLAAFDDRLARYLDLPGRP